MPKIIIHAQMINGISLKVVIFFSLPMSSMFLIKDNLVYFKQDGKNLRVNFTKLERTNLKLFY
jgi:hypothetical protein